jgi:hypothetical protein
MTTTPDVAVLAPERLETTRLRRLLAFGERHWALLVLCSFIVMRNTYAGTILLGSDSWFSFVYGRDILHHGLPHHDTLTVMGGGRAWIDQQWLGHVALYGLAALGGPKLPVLVSSLLFSLALVGAAVLAWRRGASPLVLAVTALLATFFATTVVQTEVFSRVFLLAALVLLTAESRSPSRRVWLVFPLLVLWANVHGAVVLGAGLVALLGAVELVRWSARRDRRRGALARAIALLALPWACVFATPYGFAVAHYYRLTLFSSAFHRYIDPWKPPSLSRQDAPFFVLLPIAALIVLRYHRRLGLYEKAVLAVTLLGSLEARRSIPWFATACVLFLPVASRRAQSQAARSGGSLRVAAAVFALLFAGLSVAQAAAKPQRYYTAWFYDDRAATYAARYAEAHPRAVFWANDPFGDWLPYVRPALWGKVAYDARWENLTPVQIEALSNFAHVTGPRWAEPIYRYDLVLISRRSSKKLLRALERDPRLRPVFRDRHVLIYRPAGTQAGERR